MATDKTLYDLPEDQWKDYETNPENYQDVTSNTDESNLRMMYPDKDLDEDDGDDLW